MSVFYDPSYNIITETDIKRGPFVITHYVNIKSVFLTHALVYYINLFFCHLERSEAKRERDL